ncbi:MAG TPA: tripartite tricarboxylate transporter substrate binding protein [Pseudolabrys sp.]|nr:tripartite tricarboxylate transporter substrate binding protein [Pseudolabrys sp.]
MRKSHSFARCWKALLPAAAMLLALAGTGSAAGYPDRAIKLIVPWAAGGDTDVIYRPFAQLLQKYLGQPVIIANVTGASGTVGEREAANAAPDGYTVFAPHDYIHSVYYAGLTDIRYDKAFEPVCLVASTPSVVTAGSKTPYKTFKEFVDYAKANPGKVKVGASLGSTSQYSMALMAKAAGIKVTYVPYDGTAPRMNALLGGHIDIADSNLTQKAKVDAGLLRFLAIMSEKRSPELPDVPTLKELGYDVEYAVNRGIMVPKGTPADVVKKLDDACALAAKEPDFAKAMTLQGTEARYMDAQQYTEFLKKDDAITKEITKDLGLLKREQ